MGNVQNSLMNISIITVHLNDFSGLEATCRSLQALRSQVGIQWVVIDGASSPANDGDREIFDLVRRSSDVFISEPDTGIYDAMNKGIGLAREPYLLFLNAGDRLHPEFSPTRIFGEATEMNPDMIWGSYDESGKHNRLTNLNPKGKKWLWWGMPTSHQAILFRRDFLDPDRYDESLKIAGDYDLVLRLVKKGATIRTTMIPICVSDGTGVSNIRQGAALNEQMLVRKRYFGTSTAVNQSVSAAHRLVSGIGRFRVLRKLWK